MKKVIPIILVLIMAFVFSITALADDEEDIVVLPPVDPGQNGENLDLELEPPYPNDAVGSIGGDNTETWNESDWDSYNEELLDHVEGYKNSAVYNEDIVFDAIQFIAGVSVDIYNEGNDTYMAVPGVGGWITVTNKDWNINEVKAILQWFAIEMNLDESWSGDYRLITDFEWDPETGTLRFFVDDFGLWSLFFALIERGVDPVTAARVASGKSPQTSDNSAYVGIILLTVLSAAATTVVISRKARSHN